MRYSLNCHLPIHCTACLTTGKAYFANVFVEGWYEADLDLMWVMAFWDINPENFLPLVIFLHQINLPMGNNVAYCNQSLPNRLATWTDNAAIKVDSYLTVSCAVPTRGMTSPVHVSNHELKKVWGALLIHCSAAHGKLLERADSQCSSSIQYHVSRHIMHWAWVWFELVHCCHRVLFTYYSFARFPQLTIVFPRSEFEKRSMNSTSHMVSSSSVLSSLQMWHSNDVLQHKWWVSWSDWSVNLNAIQ